MSNPTENAEWTSRLPLARGASVAATGPGGLLALEKPAGVMTHPNKADDRHASLLQADYDHERECFVWKSTGPDDPGQLFLLNRLDSPTSGLVLAALNEETAVAGRRAFASGRVHKCYFALVRGRPRPSQGIWADPLGRMPHRGSAPQHGVRMGVGRPGAGPTQMAKTHYESVETHPHAGSPLTLLKLEPITGRTHQLRVQCGFHGVPIVGDGTYGDFLFNREFARRTGHKRMFLHAASLRIPSLGFSAESPVPANFSEGLGSA
jgi:23S rRNA-/tRNA-specific pseudouridylate synthase